MKIKLLMATMLLLGASAFGASHEDHVADNCLAKAQGQKIETTKGYVDFCKACSEETMTPAYVRSKNIDMNAVCVEALKRQTTAGPTR